MHVTFYVETMYFGDAVGILVCARVGTNRERFAGFRIVWAWCGPTIWFRFLPTHSDCRMTMFDFGIHCLGNGTFTT